MKLRQLLKKLFLLIEKLFSLPFLPFRPTFVMFPTPPVKLPFSPSLEGLLWGTYGKFGTSPLKWVKLEDCKSEHLQAILDTQKQIPANYTEAIHSILEYRHETSIG